MNQPFLEEGIQTNIQNALHMLRDRGSGPFVHNNNNQQKLYDEIQNVIDKINTRPKPHKRAEPTVADQLFSGTDPLSLVHENVRRKQEELRQYAKIIENSRA